MRVLHVLHLEDDPVDAELIQTQLSRDGIAIQALRTDSEASFLASLSSSSFDLILADYRLPAYDGISALNHARELAPDVPFIFVSGVLGEEVAVEALKHGATDYVLKQGLSRLGSSIRRALKESEDKI